eukprot:COSAG01_NODE_8882_length_2627_cov_1.594541_1_plen_568_part_00
MKRQWWLLPFPFLTGRLFSLRRHALLATIACALVVVGVQRLAAVHSSDSVQRLGGHQSPPPHSPPETAKRISQGAETILTLANSETQELLALTELDDRQELLARAELRARKAGRAWHPPKHQCAGRLLPWSTALEKTIVWSGPVGPASACAKRCRTTATCELWEWCSCKSKPGCPGCLLFSGAHSEAWMPNAEGGVGAARGQACDFSRGQGRCPSAGEGGDGQQPSPTTTTHARRVVIASSSSLPAQGRVQLLQDEAAVAAAVLAVRAAQLDVAELTAWGMMTDMAYTSLVEGGSGSDGGGRRAQRVRQSKLFAQLLSHARAWKRVVELDEAVVVLDLGHGEEGAHDVSSSHGHPLTSPTLGSSAAQITFVTSDKGADNELPSSASSHGLTVPPLVSRCYAITPLAAHILYAHLWNKHYDQVRAVYLDEGSGGGGGGGGLGGAMRRPLRPATLVFLTGISLCDVCSCDGMLRAQRTRAGHSASAGPTVRHLGLLAYMREVCSRTPAMACELPPKEETLAAGPAHGGRVKQKPPAEQESTSPAPEQARGQQLLPTIPRACIARPVADT